MKALTVYYIAGQPRSGSTFVGDWIARQTSAINAGEVWQTFRAADQMADETYASRGGYWADPQRKAARQAEIEADPFWSDVLARCETHGDPFAALTSKVRETSDILVDCSKTDAGIAHYKRLGCRVIVIHTVRPFASWSQSMMRYQEKLDLKHEGAMRLALPYVRLNRRLHRTWSARGPANGDYQMVRQDQLDNLDTALTLPATANRASARYERHEMFGTGSFTGDYSKDRANPRLTLLDRVLLGLITL